jgi:hypothetical protein
LNCNFELNWKFERIIVTGPGPPVSGPSRFSPRASATVPVVTAAHAKAVLIRPCGRSGGFPALFLLPHRAVSAPHSHPTSAPPRDVLTPTTAPNTRAPPVSLLLIVEPVPHPRGKATPPACPRASRRLLGLPLSTPAMSASPTCSPT